ncbi:hypothetical protein BOX15_Mlig000665g9 [Macrostomum lignano]|uniref:HAP1 N-terminal domain-containing protein n=2 Tax=Macrostomum lignano TaxID=282301 RepID=A0A267EHR5_9PLAT|nr:hypothetical protein BOX15_Mlig000665g9 [Macrostomum lignano]
MSTPTSDIGTLTDVHSNENLAEVELVSLVTESLPRYKLRADRLVELTGYAHKDWIDVSPRHRRASITADRKASNEALTYEQISKSLDYFLLCGLRISQMTKAYHDIEAVTRLLEERETDLELAARIGKELLEKNRDLQAKCDILDEQLTQERDVVAQLRHDLHLKEELLAIYAQSEDSEVAGASASEGESLSQSVGSFAGVHLTNLERKVKQLEEENMQLRLEKSRLSSDTDGMEERETALVKDCIRQLAEANLHIKGLSDNLNQKTDLYISQQTEITQLLTKNIELESKIKRVAMERDLLDTRLREAQNAQRALTGELGDLHDRYDECLGMLDEAQQEIRALKKRQKSLRLGAAGAHLLAPPSAAAATTADASSVAASGARLLPMHAPAVPPPYEQSLMSELEMSSARVGGDHRIADNLKALETVKIVKSAAAQGLHGRAGIRPTGAAAGIALTSTSLGYATTLRDPVVAMASLVTPGDEEQRSGAASSGYRDECLSESLSVGNLSEANAGFADMNLVMSKLKKEQERRRKAVTQRYRYASEQSAGSTSPLSASNPELSSAGSSPPRNSWDVAAAEPEVDEPHDGLPPPQQQPLAQQQHHHQQQQPQPQSSLQQHLPLPKAASRIGMGIAPEKLQLVKPIEGSLTLAQWRRLATPGLHAVVVGDLPGVQIRGGLEGDPMLCELMGDAVCGQGEADKAQLSLSDIEEDDDFCRIKFKDAEASGLTYTYTNSKVMHPTDSYEFAAPAPPVAATSPSAAAAGSASKIAGGSRSATTLVPDVSKAPPGKQPPFALQIARTPSKRWPQDDGTSTFSLSFGLADVLRERGVRSAAPDDIAASASLHRLHQQQQQLPRRQRSRQPSTSAGLPSADDESASRQRSASSSASSTADSSNAAASASAEGEEDDEATPTHDGWFLPTLGAGLSATLRNLLQGVSLVAGGPMPPSSSSDSSTSSASPPLPPATIAGLNIFGQTTVETSSTANASAAPGAVGGGGGIVHRVSSLSPADLEPPS